MLDNLYEDIPMRSIDGDLLHHDLANFYFQCKDNYDNYKAYKKDPERELLPVFVTYAEEKEFNDVKNWAIAKLKNECEKLMKIFNDSQSSEKFLALFTKIKWSQKLQLMQFYENLKDEVSRKNIETEEPETAEIEQYDWSQTEI